MLDDGYDERGARPASEPQPALPWSTDRAHHHDSAAESKSNRGVSPSVGMGEGKIFYSHGWESSHARRVTLEPAARWTTRGVSGAGQRSVDCGEASIIMLREERRAVARGSAGEMTGKG